MSKVKLTKAQRIALEAAVVRGEAYPNPVTVRVLVRLGYAKKLGGNYGMTITEAGLVALGLVALKEADG